MRKLIIPVAFLASTTALACSFQVGTKARTPRRAQPRPQAQPQPQPQASTPAPAPTPQAPPPGRFTQRMGHVRVSGTHAVPPTVTRPGTATAPATSGTATPSTPSSPGTPAYTPPSGVLLMTGTNAFGSGTYDPTGFKAMFYMIPMATTKMPAFESLQPYGVFFTHELNVAPQTLTTGFPGIDPSRNKYFAIQYEAPLVVNNEADYELRVSSDDGAVVLIDGMKIVDNDGKHTVQSKSGPVHLVRGTHLLTVQYFQIDGPVALQLFCKRTGQEEKICPLTL